LQEAYLKLKAELKGFTFTEEDLYNMYERDAAQSEQSEKVYENDA
jgi:hypothetical protein